MPTLRSRLIKLAHSDKALRPVLLPLLKQAKSPAFQKVYTDADVVKAVQRDFKSADPDSLKWGKVESKGPNLWRKFTMTDDDLGIEGSIYCSIDGRSGGKTTIEVNFDFG
jgi:hypothetical protein